MYCTYTGARFAIIRRHLNTYCPVYSLHAQLHVLPTCKQHQQATGKTKADLLPCISTCMSNTCMYVSIVLVQHQYLINICTNKGVHPIVSSASEMLP